MKLQSEAPYCCELSDAHLRAEVFNIFALVYGFQSEAAASQGGGGGSAQLNKCSNPGGNKGILMIFILVCSQYIIFANMGAKTKKTDLMLA